MLKKIKENKTYQKFKELRSNPQTSAIISLAIWLVFFFIVILITRGMTSTKTNTPKNNEIISTLKNYEYTYTNNKRTIYGKKYGDKQIFIVGNNKYYDDGKNVHQIKNQNMTLIPNFDLYVLKITPKMIDNLTAKLEPTEDNESKKYIVPLVNFINLYEVDVDVDLTDALNYNILISKYYKNNKLYMIKLDLTNYYKYKNIEDDGILTIDIYNTGKINNFTSEYDSMIGVVE